jgi:hypothetical protein
MSREREILELIRLRTRELESTMMEASGHTGTEDELLTLFVELEDLRNELAFLRENPDEPDALVDAPLMPRPHLNFGAVAIPEPD